MKHFMDKVSFDTVLPVHSKCQYMYIHVSVNVYCIFCTLICLFIVMQKSMMKYITSIGQNTGTLKASKNVQIMAMTMPFVAECLAREVT